MQEIRENITIKYDAMHDYRLYSKGKLVGHIPAVIDGLNMDINYYNGQVRLLNRGYIIAFWANIDVIQVHSLLGD